MEATCHQWRQFRFLSSFRLYAIVLIAMVGVLLCAPIAVADLVAEPSAAGSGSYAYDGSNLTLTGVTINQITFGFSFVPSPHVVTAPTWVTDPVAGSSVGSGDGAVAEMIGLTYDGSGYGFSDGTFKLSLGSDVVMTADMVDVALSMTAADTAIINSSLASVNLTNVVVTQPSAGTSQFVTDWLFASQGSGLGALQLTFVNTLEGGSFDDLPLDSTSGGSALLALQPVTPEPASLLMILAGGSWVSCVYRRRRQIR